MSTGYPLIPQRGDFPDLEDLYPPENPKTDIGARTFNLMFHQVAGHGLANPVRVTLIGKYSSALGAFQVDYLEEAWNDRHEQPHPVLARSSAGVYTLTFPATVLDMDGVSVPLSLIACRASRGTATVNVAFTDASNRVVQITGADDAQFWIEVA